MKIGVISDIHSNIDALNEILKEFDNNNVDKIIVLGDSIGIGPFPEEVMKKLIEKKESIIGYVIGNHEGYLLKGIPEYKHNSDSKEEIDKIPEEEIRLHSWNHKQLSIESINFIRTIPDSKLIEVCGKKIYISHYPLKPDGKYKNFIKMANAEEFEELYDDVNADIYLYGHTHKQNIVNKDNKYYINPGSVGCPKNTDAACSVIIDIDETGSVEVKELNVAYDIDKTIDSIRNLKYPLCEMMIKVFYR